MISSVIMNQSGFDDVMFSIINRATGEVVFPSMYSMLRVDMDSKGSVYIEFASSDNNSHAYLSFPRDVIDLFVNLLKLALDGKDASIDDTTWFLLYYPASGENADDIWMCEIQGAHRQDDKVYISFSWKYFKEDQDIAMETIKKFADSEAIVQLERTIAELRDFPTEETQDVVLEIADRVNFQFLDLEKDFSRVDIAAEILMYKVFNGYYMRKTPEGEPRDIVLEMTLSNVEEIVKILKELGSR